MCVIFFYVNSNPLPGGYKLILASNRDEFYARETLPAAKWKNAEHVYGGIDLEPGREGGTWLAIGGHKGVYKIGALLNLTGEPRPRNAAVSNHIILPTTIPAPTQEQRPQQLPLKVQQHNNNSLLGRGSIVSDFVKSADECSIDDYNSKLFEDCEKYTAFNFVSIEIGSPNEPAKVRLLSNVPPLLEHYKEEKCYGFGNSLPSVPFKKVEYGQQRFETIVEQFNSKLKQENDDDAINKHRLQNELINNLKSLLKCKEKFWPDAELKRRAPNWGEYLSALNVRVPHEGYGSRTHTIILIDENDKMHFVEETMASLDPDGEWLKTHIEKQYFQK